MSDADLTYLSIADATAQIEGGKLSPVDLVAAAFRRIKEKDGAVNAFVTLMEDQAMAEAKAAEAQRGAGRPLNGVPIVIKDLYNTAGVKTTSCSKIRADFVPDRDATTVAKLRAAGAVVLGKVTTHEFAFGFDAPPTANPWDLGCAPSGSSGGTGASLAAGFCMGGTGSDTGGSIRAPAAACGISGIKPTYGRASKEGVAVLSWTLDHTGPMARTARDCAIMLGVMAGADPGDPTTIDEPVPDYVGALNGDISGLKIGVPTNHFYDRLQPAVETHVEAALKQLESSGAELVSVTLPNLDNLIPVFLAIIMGEAGAYHRDMLRANPDGYNDDVQLLVEQGQFLDAGTYIHAQRARQALREGFRQAFDGIDMLAVPGLPVTAVRRAEGEYTWPDGQTESVFHAHARFNCPFNLTGLPGCTIPVGFSDDGLPVGMQLVGRPFDEATVLRTADAYQRVTDWHTKRPVF